VTGSSGGGTRGRGRWGSRTILAPKGGALGRQGSRDAGPNKAPPRWGGRWACRKGGRSGRGGDIGRCWTHRGHRPQLGVARARPCRGAGHSTGKTGNDGETIGRTPGCSALTAATNGGPSGSRLPKTRLRSMNLLPSDRRRRAWQGGTYRGRSSTDFMTQTSGRWWRHGARGERRRSARASRRDPGHDRDACRGAKARPSAQPGRAVGDTRRPAPAGARRARPAPQPERKRKHAGKKPRPSSGARDDARRPQPTTTLPRPACPPPSQAAAARQRRGRGGGPGAGRYTRARGLSAFAQLRGQGWGRETEARGRSGAGREKTAQALRRPW